VNRDQAADRENVVASREPAQVGRTQAMPEMSMSIEHRSLWGA